MPVKIEFEEVVCVTDQKTTKVKDSKKIKIRKLAFKGTDDTKSIAMVITFTGLAENLNPIFDPMGVQVQNKNFKIDFETIIGSQLPKVPDDKQTKKKEKLETPQTSGLDKIFNDLDNIGKDVGEY